MTSLRDRIYLATIAADAADLAQRHDLGLELDQFCTAANMDADFPSWDAQAREQLARVKRSIFHAPFAELSPCAIDPLIREVAHRRLMQAAELCHRYGIRRMVVHSGFIPHVYFPEWFVEQGAAFFRSLLAELPDDFHIYIENVLDPEPAPLLDLAEAIGDPRARLCLDVGHAHAVSAVPVRDWIRALGPALGHFHLHDNDGSRDQHGLPGDGTLGFPALLDDILAAAPDATLTCECLDAATCVQRLSDFGVL